MSVMGSSLPAPAADTYAVFTDAGWSSSVARWAHNPEVAGSNPAPATKKNRRSEAVSGQHRGRPLAVLLGSRPAAHKMPGSPSPVDVDLVVGGLRHLKTLRAIPTSDEDVSNCVVGVAGVGDVVT